jgi:hypothetical protein
MKKITYTELKDAMYNFNDEHSDGKASLYGVIVFTENSFDKPYTETERSYRVSNDNKGFQHGKISNSIYGNCLDNKDLGVRLDWYMHEGWKVDYCYLEEAKA